MEDKNKTKKQLIEELNKLRQCVAELKGFEEEIKQTRVDQEKFAKAFLQNSIPVGITTLKEGRFVDVSNAFLKLMGRKREEVVGHTSVDIGFITEEQRVIFFNELNKKGRVENLEMKVRTKGGALRDGLFNAVMMNFNNEGYLLTVMTDISERKHMEDTLIESERRLMQAQSIAHLGNWEIDLTNQMMWASEEAFRIYGIEYTGPASACMPLTQAQKVVHPEDRPRMDSALKALLQDNKTYDQEFRIFRANDGELRVIHSRADLLFSKEKIPVRVFGTIQDITDRKQAEEKLRESEERFKTLFEKSVDAQVLLDHEGKMIDCNDAHVKLFGLQGKSEIFGHTPVDFAPEFQINGTPSSEMGKKIRITMLEKGSARFEWLHQKHDPAHTPILTELSCTLIQIANRPMIHAVIRDITGRKHAEEKLRESEERYRHLVKHAPTGIFEADFTAGKYLSVNDVMCQYTGYTREEFLSLNPIQLLAEESVEAFIQRHAKVLAGEPVPDNIEFKIKRKDGSEFWALLNTRYLYEPNNRIIATVIVHDITERKQAQDAQIEQLKFLQVLIDTIPIPVFFKDINGIYLGCNRACETFFGPRDQLIGKTVYDVSPKDIADIYYRADLELFNNPGTQIYETLAADKTGARHNVIFNKATYQDKNGNVAGLIGAIFDITDRKKTEQSLRASEEKYRAIIENMQEGYHEVDLKGNFMFVNESMRKIIGYEREELLGMNNRQYADEENNRKVYQVYNRVYRTGEPVENFEWQVIRKDGDRRDIEVSISLIRDTDDNPTGFRGIVRDTTDRKRAEEALREREAKIVSVFRAAPVGIGVVINRVIKEVNNSLCVMTGYDQEELLGKDARILYPSDVDYEFVGREKYRQLAEQGTGTVETRWRRKDGKIINIILSSTAIDPNDQSHGVTFSALDITERKRTEQELEKAEKRYRSIFENAMEGIYQSTPDGRFLQVNPAMSRIYGYDSPADMEHSVTDIAKQVYVNPDDRKYLKEILEKNNHIEKFEYQVRKKNGDKIWVSNNASAMRDNDGHILYYEGLVQDITERKQAEIELQASEDKFYKAFQANPSLMAIRSRKDGRFINVNEAYIRVMGYSQEELIGSNSIALGITESASYESVRETINKQGFIRNQEVKIRTKTGDIHTGLFSATVIEIKGEPCLLSGFQDITERKQAEDALRKSEANFQRIFDESPIGAAIVSPDYRFTRVNGAMCRMMGYAEEEFASLRFQDITHPDHLGGDLEQVRRLASGKTERYETEKRYIRKDGNIIWGRLSVQAIRDARGQILYFLPMVVDITIRKQMEETLKAERERLISILDGIPVPTFVIDRNRRVLLWNSNNEIYTGIAKEEVLGKPLDLSSIFREKVSPTLAELILEMGDEELTARFGARGLRKSDIQPHTFESTGRIWIGGEERILIIQAARILDTNGKVVGAIQTGQDITDRAQLEVQLRQAQKMEAIGTLAGGIAHDFNNILSAILGYTELVLGEPELDNHLRRYLDQVFKAGERARDLVKQILAFSRQSDEKPRPLRVSPIVKEVMKLLKASLPTTIRIHQDIHKDWDTVIADPAQIHQILMNLCTNAAYAMRGRKGELKIGLAPVNIEPPDNLIIHNDLSPGRYLRLTVGDTGAGIDNEIIDRIFDPFFTTKKPGEGTGLGLSVVHGIVKSYGGAITVQSETGKGTEFNVYLPLLNEVEDKYEAKVEERVPRGKERILFVDDEAALVQLAMTILNSLGYEVTGRTSSLDALELFRTRPDSFDLVITDMTMPNMTGSELAQQLMRIRPDIPVILCTGFSEAVTQEKARAIGVKEFIMKPIVQRQIAEAIRRVLKKEE